MHAPISIAIHQESDVVVASMQTMKIAEQIGMKPVDCNLCATAVSELATNIIRYAHRGEIRLHVEQNTLHVLAKDRGNGIADIDLAMQEGHSGGSGLGMGLSGVARIMDSMKIESQAGKGTSVFTSKTLRQTGQRLPKIVLRTQAVTIDDTIMLAPYPGEHHIGDGALLLDMPEHRFLALWDVSGHGKEAHMLSKQIASFIGLHLQHQPDQLLQSIHKRFHGTRGLVAVVGCLHVASGRLAYAGVGNVSMLYLHQGGTRRLPLQEGVMGYQIRTPVLQHITLQPNDTIIMHSDGIQTIRDPLYINEYTTAQQLARRLMREYPSQQADDASCLVLRYNTNAMKPAEAAL